MSLKGNFSSLSYQRVKIFFFLSFSGLFLLSQFQNCAAPYQLSEELKSERETLEVSLKPQTFWTLSEIVHQGENVSVPAQIRVLLEFKEKALPEGVLCPGGTCPSEYDFKLSQNCQEVSGLFSIQFDMEQAGLKYQLLGQVLPLPGLSGNCPMNSWDQFIYSYFQSQQLKLESLSSQEIRFYRDEKSYLQFSKR